MITSKQIIEKFCEGPAATFFSPEMIQECSECVDLEGLMHAVSHHMDFKYEAKAAAFIMKYLDYEID